MSHLRYIAIVLTIIVSVVFIFKDAVFRNFPNAAVIYNDNDLLTSRRVFDSGRVWKFSVGHKLSEDISKIERSGTHCEYRSDTMNEFLGYYEFSKNATASPHKTIFIQCDGYVVTKYFEIYVDDRGSIVRIDLTVSMIGTI